MNDLVSLLICTLNRVDELHQCVASLLKQTHRNIQIVIVDQSEEINNQYNDNEIVTYLNIKEKGLSNARNVGLPYCKGDWIALIDDDAVYDSEYIKNALDIIASQKAAPGIVSGVGFDPKNKVYLIPSMKEKKVKRITWNNCFKYCMSAGMIIRKDIVIKSGFDIDFGVGAGTIFGSGEESDIVIEALKSNEIIIFNPNMVFYHKADIDISPEKSFSYNCGKGALLKKHYLITKRILFLRLFISTVLRSIVGCILFYLGKKQYRKSIYALKGKIHGFCAYKKS